MSFKKSALRNIGTFFSKINWRYEYKVFPHIKHLRGATRIKLTLTTLSTLGLDGVKETDDLFDRDFDNLIIIDACRHDLFEEVEGKTDYRYSRGSNSQDFIRENFSEGDFSDFVVITGNLFFEEDLFEETTGRKLYDVFHEVFKTFVTKWDEEEKTVKPDSIIEDLKVAQKLFPDKRKIVWFMQPHHPFIESDIQDTGMELGLDDKVWDRAKRREINEQELWKAYKDNLEYVLPHVDKASEILEGEDLLTSDHGNLVGKNGLYGHPERLNLKDLRKVPVKEI